MPCKNIINNDGRNYLASTTRQYDVIISEPSNPWITGVSDLFTIDHFRAASQALAPHGIFCQWVQLYELSPENIQAVFRAMAAVFPYMMVFAAEDLSSDTVILLSYDPIPFDYERVRQAMATTVREGENTVATELERAGVHSPFDLFSRVILASREEVLAYSSQPTVSGRGCAEGFEDQSQFHLEPIYTHNRGICIGADGVGGAGQCDDDGDCEGDGVRCLVGPMMGVCQDGLTQCTDDAQCRDVGEEAVDARCQICAVELNTDDNSRIEFNAPRDLIGFQAHENTVSRFYSPEWPYGRLCRDPSDEANCRLRNMGEGAAAASNYADLGLSLLGCGKLEEARRLIEHSTSFGRSERSNIAAEVYQLLLDDSSEPAPTFGRPDPPAQVSDEMRAAVRTMYEQVSEAIEHEQWQNALGAFERLPSGMLQAAGPDLAFMAAYVLYKNATSSERRDPRFSREAARILTDLGRLDEDYVRAHPETFYYLGRCYVLENAFNEARRFMTRYVELRTAAPAATDEARPEAGVSNGDGVSDKDEQPDYGSERSVPPSEADAEPASEPAAVTTDSDEADGGEADSAASSDD